MIQLEIYGSGDSDNIRKLVKTFYRTENVTVKPDGFVSNTLKRKLINDRITQFISFIFCAGSLCVTFFDENHAEVKKYEALVEDSSREIYKILERHTGKKLAWGTMTGVHPAKPLLLALEKGTDSVDIRDSYAKKYMISREKSNLVWDVAKAEYNVLKDIDYKDNYSIYIGIPFCPTTCIYCSFTSFSMGKWGGYVESYLDALKTEISAVSDMLKDRMKGKNSPLTVYVGGGTPTSLTDVQLEDLLAALRKNFDFSDVIEFTVEAGRPDSIDEKKLAVMKKYGVSRISINPQTMNQHTLDFIGRHHSTGDVVKIFDAARNMGFDNINMDIIMGLPGENPEDVRNTIENILQLSPENITVHTLALKRAAALSINVKEYEDMLDRDVTKMVDLSYAMLGKAGYLPYYLYRQKNMADGLENTGYSKKGFECIYNIMTMEEIQTIIALGAGAVSKFVTRQDGNIHIERVDNVRNLRDYIDRIDDMIEKKRVFLKEWN